MAGKAKTRPGSASVEGHIAALDNSSLRADAEMLADLLTKISGEEPVMWGPSIIGFGSYDYTYDSGHSGSSSRIGFAARETGLVIYIVPGFDEFAVDLAALGPHKTAKSCLYVKKLSDVNLEVLAEIARKALAIMDERYPRT